MKNDVDVCVYLVDDHIPAAGTADGIGAGLLPFSLHGSQIFHNNYGNKKHTIIKLLNHEYYVLKTTITA